MEKKVATEKKVEKVEQVSSGYYEKPPQFGYHGPSRIGKEFKRGMATFVVIAASIVFYFVFLRITNLFNGFGVIVRILKPILYGLILAYLLHPAVEKIEFYLAPFFEKRIKKAGVGKRIARLIGIAVSLIVLITFVVTLLNLIIPELYSSISKVIIRVPNQLNTWADKINAMQSDTSTLATILQSGLEQGTAYFQKWISNDLSKQINVFMTGLTVGIIGVVREMLNIVIGVVVSIYVLNSRETFSAQSKKILYAIMKPGHANMTLHITKKSDEMFSGFIVGKTINSLIIGVICYICLSFLNMPYTLLVSVIIGVTNIIPFFGPFIGAIPSSILILLEDPKMGLYFIIFIIILQQFDGNILGPKILGDATGLSAFWVIFAILVGAGLFGFIGMIMGVPTFAVIYYIIKMMINSKLEKKKLPTATTEYNQMSYVDDNTGKFIKRGTIEDADQSTK